MEKFHDFYFKYVSKERDEKNEQVQELTESWANERIAITSKGSVVAGLPQKDKANWRHFVDINIIPILKEHINKAIGEKKQPVLVICNDANPEAIEYISNIMDMKYRKNLKVEHLENSNGITKKTRTVERQSKRCFALPKVEDVYRLKYIIEEI